MSEPTPDAAQQARRPARRVHAASAHGALALACVAVTYFTVAMFYRVFACWGHPNYPNLLCHIRGNMLVVLLLGFVLMLLALLFSAEHDPLDHLTSVREPGLWKRPGHVRRATVRALLHPGTPHRKKTASAGLIGGLMAIGFIAIMLFGEIAF